MSTKSIEKNEMRGTAKAMLIQSQQEMITMRETDQWMCEHYKMRR